MANNIAIIYGDSSKFIRRIIISDTNEELALATSVLSSGEAVLLLNYKIYSVMKPEDFYQAIFNEGLTMPQRCVETDKDGRVISVVTADPMIDRPLTLNAALQLHEKADIGDSLKDGILISNKPPIINNAPTVADKNRVISQLGA